MRKVGEQHSKHMHLIRLRLANLQSADKISAHPMTGGAVVRPSKETFGFVISCVVHHF
jgi:hypothetical protein